MHTYNQDLVSVTVARYISYAPKVCSHCSRCCCCLLLYDIQHMGIHLNSARGPGLHHRSWPLSFLHLPSIPSSQWLLSISKAPWHIPLGCQQWWQDHLQIGSLREHLPKTHVTRPPAAWWRARDWVGSLVDPDLHIRHFAETLANTNLASHISVHSPD